MAGHEGLERAPSLADLVLLHGSRNLDRQRLDGLGARLQRGVSLSSRREPQDVSEEQDARGQCRKPQTDPSDRLHDGSSR